MNKADSPLRAKQEQPECLSPFLVEDRQRLKDINKIHTQIGGHSNNGPPGGSDQSHRSWVKLSARHSDGTEIIENMDLGMVQTQQEMSMNLKQRESSQFQPQQKPMNEHASLQPQAPPSIGGNPASFAQLNRPLSPERDLNPYQSMNSKNQINNKKIKVEHPDYLTESLSGPQKIKTIFSHNNMHHKESQGSALSTQSGPKLKNNDKNDEFMAIQARVITLLNSPYELDDTSPNSKFD